MLKLKSIIPILLLGVSINAFAKPPVWELLHHSSNGKQLYADIGNIVSLGNHKVKFVSKFVSLSEGTVMFSMNELNCKTGKGDMVIFHSSIPELPEVGGISSDKFSITGALLHKICAKKGEK